MYRRIIRHGLLPVLLLIHVWLAVGGSDRVGLVYDEPVHIVSGLYYNTTGDHRFQPENGILPQRIEALPWLLAGQRPPALDGYHWENAEVWELSTRMLENAGDQRVRLLQLSRLTTALAGAAVLLLIYVWSLRLFGRTGAILTTALAAFCPNMIAHAGLATTDTWGVLGALVAVLAWWSLCHRVSATRVIIAGIAAGFFAVCKFSCVLFVPVAGVLLVVRLLHNAPLPWSCGRLQGRCLGMSKIAPLATGGLLAVLLAVAFLWANYGFRYAASPEGSGGFISTWSSMLIEKPELVGLPQLGHELDEHTVLLTAGPLQKAITFARNHRLLPEAWLYGLAFVGRNSQSRLSYFSGEYSVKGWRSYFPTAFLLKTTPGGLLALGCALVACIGVRQKRRIAYRLAPVGVLVVVLLAAAITSRINIGLRHILPVISGLWMLCGVVCLLRPGRPRRVLLLLVAIGCTGQAFSTLRIFPHTLTYFNPIAGESPDHWLVDSNLDWGQGLPELSRWLENNPVKRPVYLTYFGTDNPAWHDIDAIRFADFPFDRGTLRLPAELNAGWYCFGPTQFRRVYGDTRGPWTHARERIYQTALREVVGLMTIAESAPEITTSLGQIELLKQFDALRLARLGFYLQNRLPDLRLPGGIMVYKLSAEDLQLAFYADLQRLANAVENRQETDAATSP